MAFHLNLESYNRGKHCKTPPFAMVSRGFTLIEILLVMMIAGASIGLAAPRLISAYDSIKASAEERKLTNFVETVRIRSFLRQVSYTIEFENNILKIKNGNTRVKFDYIDFPPAYITFNANGFTDSDALRYIIRGEEKVLNVSQQQGIYSG